MGRRIFVLAAVFTLSGCSFVFDFDEVGFVDATIIVDAQPPDRACTMTDLSMCEADEKCGVKADDGNTLTLVCAPAGSVATHGRCIEPVANGPTDDCVADNFCYQNTCYPLVAAGTCLTTEMSQTFLVGTETLEICVPVCDVATAPTCPVSLGCYLATDRLSTAGLCYAPGSTALGGTCTRVNDCMALGDCPARNVCVALCPPGNAQFCIDASAGTMCLRDINDLVGECG